MSKRFFDSFHICVDTYRTLDRAQLSHAAMMCRAVADASEHLKHVVEVLRGKEISPEILDIVGVEPKDLTVVIRNMGRDEQRLVVKNLFDQVTERIDEMLPRSLTPAGEEHLAKLRGALTGALEVFGFRFPELTAVDIGGEVFAIYNWPALRAEVTKKWRG